MRRLYLMTVTHTYDSDYTAKAFATEKEAITAMNEWLDAAVKQQEEMSGYTPYVFEVEDTCKKMFYNEEEDVQATDDYTEVKVMTIPIDLNIISELLTD